MGLYLASLILGGTSITYSAWAVTAVMGVPSFILGYNLKGFY